MKILILVPWKKWWKLFGGILVSSVSMGLANSRFGLKSFLTNFLIQFSKLNKNMSMRIIWVDRKIWKMQFIEKKWKIEFVTFVEFFEFFEWKEACKNFREHIFLLAMKFSIEWYIKHQKKKFCFKLALRAPYNMQFFKKLYNSKRLCSKLLIFFNER